MDGIEFNVDLQGVGLLVINCPQVWNALMWEAMQVFADAVKETPA